MDQNIKLMGNEVYLRPITSDDTDLIVKWRNQENVMKYFFYRGAFTKEGHEQWLEEKVKSGKVVQFIVCMKENDKPVGSTFLRDIDTVHKKAEFGFFLGEEDVRGRGIGKDIVNVTVEYAFKIMELHRVYARAFESNKPSVESFLKNGFVQEGIFKDSVYTDGEYHDVVCLAKINPYEN